MIDLLPCPFCGSKPNPEDPMTFGKSPGGKYGFVTCCCEGPEVRLGRSDEESWQLQAASAWNKRAIVGESAFKQRIKQGALFFFHVIGWLCVIFIAWLGINVLSTFHAEAKEMAMYGGTSEIREGCLARKRFAEEVTWLRVSGKPLDVVLEDYDAAMERRGWSEEDIQELRREIIFDWTMNSGVYTPGAWMFRLCMRQIYRSSSRYLTAPG